MLLNTGIQYLTSCSNISLKFSGEFYGQAPEVTTNLDLIARFFEKYPGYADKAFLSVKASDLH